MTSNEAVTIGDLATVISEFKEQGIAHQSIQYALNRVYAEEIETEKEWEEEILRKFDRFREGTEDKEDFPDIDRNFNDEGRDRVQEYVKRLTTPTVPTQNQN